MKELTNRQDEVLQTVKRFISANGYSPTVREIAFCMSVCSKAAFDHLTALKKKGAITWTEKKTRTIRIVE